ncbi:hypothetical protein ANN_18061 [Periplaneta americana]|uniref:Endonuclease-reverse transcriptase n=1 Tax=Periplaneta americana TaxID=6978 RepID=A0ABQ8SMP2_PERAM|nr:hypothetical protein ANN_18061 [Periplaneta americana]
MGAETWTLRQSEEKRMKAFEMWIWRRMERVKWTDRIRNEAVLERVGEERVVLKLIMKRKRNWLEVEKFKYLGATVTNINDTREEIKHRINMGNACYYSVEKYLSSSQLSKNVKVRIYKTVILPVVLYGCETWTLTLRQEHRLRVFENKVLRKIFGAKRDEVTGEWRKLNNTELHALYSSPDIIRNIKFRRLRWAGHVARIGESRNAYRVLVGGSEGKRPLGRPRRRWDDNIKMDLREVGYDDREWINLAQDRGQWRAYVRAAMNLRSCRSRFIFRAERPWSIGWFYTRRFVCNCGRHLQWSGIRGRKTLLGVPEATDPVALSPENESRSIDSGRESLHCKINSHRISCLRYAEKSLATSDTTPLKMSAAVADETSGIKLTNRPRPLSPENESRSIDSSRESLHCKIFRAVFL